MNGPEEAVTIPPLKPQQLSVAAARLDPLRLFEFLLPACTPIASRSRKHTPEDAKFIGESEVQRLLAADILEPARSPWRAQVLVVHQGPKKRLVIDYSTTINRFTLLDAYPLPNIEELVNNVAQARYYSSLDLRSAYEIGRIGLQKSGCRTTLLVMCLIVFGPDQSHYNLSRLWYRLHWPKLHG